jgi:2-polyprenyl-6-methoxyphenol hydroxylase-like FAD-dependent oxidoreductase
VENIVIGGGPAGAATACGLAAAFREVVLIERSDAPHHKVCGEFLSVETQMQLRALGVDAEALGAVVIDKVAVYSPTRSVTTALPFRALSLSRYRLDDALLRRAEACGARIERGVGVRNVAPDGEGWLVRCDNDEEMHCRHLVFATGKLGLRGIDDTRDGSRVGLKMHLRLTDAARDALAGRVELYFLDRSYAGLELIEDGIANLCLLMPCDLVARHGPGWAAIQSHLTQALPSLAARLAGAQPLWDKPLAVVCPAAWHLHREEGPAVYRVGDRLAHIPPFTGDGLAIALASARLAAEHIGDGRPPGYYLAAARKLTGNPIRLAGLLSGLASTGAGRTALLGVASLAPGLLEGIVRRTRLPLPAQWNHARPARLANALPIEGRTVS